MLLGRKQCSLCTFAGDSINHVFTCCIAIVLRKHICNFAGGVKYPPFNGRTLIDLVHLHKRVTGNEMMKKVIQVITWVTSWSISRARKLIFENIPCMVTNIVGEIKILSFLWISSRYKRLGVTWNDWMRFAL